MKIDILTVLPELLESPFSHSILKRAKEKGLLEIRVHHLRQWAVNEYGQIDDYQYGGGAGMVMMPEPLARAIESLSQEAPYDQVIYMTPDGERLNQRIANQLSLQGNLLLICGHYKGIDQRIREQYVTREISIGDYVLSGGELAAAVLVDAIGRLLPGVLNDETSALSTLSRIIYLLLPYIHVRPISVVRKSRTSCSAATQKIEDWRHEESLRRTAERRPDLLDE